LAKDYPDECPVFEGRYPSGKAVVGQFWGYWPGGLEEPEFFGSGRVVPFPVMIGDSDCFCLGQLTPLTPAARDLLAAIRQELGQ
jgi:hypothetical protein